MESHAENGEAPFCSLQVEGSLPTLLRPVWESTGGGFAPRLAGLERCGVDRRSEKFGFEVQLAWGS